MNIATFLAWFSGPVNAAIRYGLTALGTWLIAKGVDQGAAEQIIGGLIAAIPSILGILTSIAPVKKVAAAQLPDVAAVQTKSGKTIVG